METVVGDLRTPPALPQTDRVIAPFRTFMHLSGDAERVQALSAAAGLLGEGGRFVFDVFEPSEADIRATHDRWIARREGISERPLWDAAERRLELDVRLPGRVVPMTLEWRSGAEWIALCAEAGLTVVSAESGFGGELLDGRQGDQVYICERLQLVERQRACDCDVERLGAVGQRDAGDGIRGCDLGREAGALAAQREGDRGGGRELGQRALAAGVQCDHGQQRRLGERDHGHRVERAHARPHRARRERIGAALGQRHVRGAEALRAAQQRSEVARVRHAIEKETDRARRRSRDQRREVVGAQHADGAARMRKRRQRGHHLGRAAQDARAGRCQLVGNAVAAEVVVDECLDGRDARCESGAQRVLALVGEEAGALALLGLAERARRFDVAVGAARDHAGTPLSAATGAQAGCAPTVSTQSSSRAWPPSAPAWCSRQSEGIAEQSASVRRSRHA